MIIGNGMLAKAFSPYTLNESFVIFASGVSNSLETRVSEFDREIRLLEDVIKKHKEKTIAYFSTCSIDDPTMTNSPYVIHKRKIENFISEIVPHYYIFRLPIVVGKATNSTIVNYLYQKIKSDEQFELWSGSARNLIDVEDVFKIVDYILLNKIYKNKKINIASFSNIPIQNIIEIFENILNKKAKFSLIDKGAAYDINICAMKKIIENLDIKFKDDYTERTINKYYASFIPEEPSRSNDCT